MSHGVDKIKTNNGVTVKTEAYRTINRRLDWDESEVVGSESPCRAELPTHKVYFSISSSVEIFRLK